MTTLHDPKLAQNAVVTTLNDPKLVENAVVTTLHVLNLLRTPLVCIHFTVAPAALSFRQLPAAPDILDFGKQLAFLFWLRVLLM